MRKKLTAPGIQKIKPGAKVLELSDGGSALRAVVQVSGHKSFAMRFRRPDGRHAKLTLGEFNDGPAASGAPVIGGPLTLHEARILAAEVNRKRAMGIDVVAEEMAAKLRRKVEPAVRAANLFPVVAREFVESRGQLRHWRETARFLGLDYPRDGSPPDTIPGSLCARWKDKQVGDIDGADLHAVVNEATKHGIPGLPVLKDGASPIRGRKIAGALGAMFQWALRHRRINSNPMRDVWRPNVAPSRERVLDNIEIAALWRATEKVGIHGKVWKLLLLTGLRRNEVARLEWSELSDDLAVINLPGKRTKNGRPHVVWLPPQAQEVLRSIERKGRYVFSSTGTGQYPLGNFDPPKKMVDELMQPAAPWVTHDIRRSVVTGLGELGVQPQVIELLVNHTSGSRGGVAGVYNKAELMAERKAALERWGAHIEALVTGKKAKVVPLHREA